MFLSSSYYVSSDFLVFATLDWVSSGFGLFLRFSSRLLSCSGSGLLFEVGVFDVCSVMVDSGDLEGLQIDCGNMENSPCTEENVEILAPIENGASESPVIRRSARKTPIRSSVSRGRSKKSMPKSPLMRMVEIRKGGLRGRALRQAGFKGLEGSEVRSGKGLKGFGGRRLAEEPVSPEVLGEGLSKEGAVSEVKELAGVEAVMAEDRDVLGDSVSAAAGDLLEWLPEGVGSDLALDLVESQPLQEMMFVGKQLPENDILLEEPDQEKGERVGTLEADTLLGNDEKFPPLSKERLISAKKKKEVVAGREEKLLGMAQDTLPKIRHLRTKMGLLEE